MLKINHLYSKSLNIYGDLGNIIALKYRAELRGITAEVIHTELGEEISESDIYFIGGGQDQDQILVFEDLLKRKDFIISEVGKGKIFLLICGGYQLFGKYFLDGSGNKIEGLNILDIETQASDYNVSSRCIGNIVVEMNQEFINTWNIDISFSKYIVGFENHGGETMFLSSKVKALGNVVHGFGNNAVDKLEGGFYKNIIGSYCHGSLLPKNPHLTDALLRKALKNKGITLADLHDKVHFIEQKAHYHIIKMSEK